MAAAGQRVGYVRVSAFDQNAERQLDGVAVDRMFLDKKSGKSDVDQHGRTDRSACRTRRQAVAKLRMKTLLHYCTYSAVWAKTT